MRHSGWRVSLGRFCFQLIPGTDILTWWRRSCTRRRRSAAAARPCRPAPVPPAPSASAGAPGTARRPAPPWRRGQSPRRTAEEGGPGGGGRSRWRRRPRRQARSRRHRAQCCAEGRRKQITNETTETQVGPFVSSPVPARCSP